MPSTLTLATQLSSRVFLIRWAISLTAQSHGFSSQTLEPGARYFTLWRRRGLLESCRMATDFGSRAPRLMMWSGSPSEFVMWPSSSVAMMRPHPQEQKGQISKEDAERLLQALENDEKKVLQKVKEKQMQAKRVPVEKDW